MLVVRVFCRGESRRSPPADSDSRLVILSLWLWFTDDGNDNRQQSRGYFEYFPSTDEARARGKDCRVEELGRKGRKGDTRESDRP